MTHQGWKSTNLGDVITDVLDFRGRTPKKLGMDWGGGDIHALSAINVRAGYLDLSRTSHFGSDALYNRWMTKGNAACGDVLITTEAPLGNIAQVPDDRRYILSQRVILLKPRSTVIDPAFLAHQMRGAQFQALLDDHRSGSTATGIRQSRLVTLPVQLPPLNEQRRIVAKLEALQSRSRRAREALDAVPPLLEKLRQSILAAAFRGDLTKDWRAKHKDVEPASELLKRIRVERRKKWEEGELAKMRAKGKAAGDEKWKAKYREPEAVEAAGLPELPEGWCWASVDELIVDGPTNGFSPKSEGTGGAGTPTLKLSATTRGYCLLNDATTKRTVDAIGEDEPYWLSPGDILLHGANTIEYVGVSAIFDGPERTFIYPDLMMRLRAAPEVGPRLLWRALSWEFCRKFMRDRATGTAGNMPKVNGDTVRRTPIALPPSAEQVLILDLLDRAHSFRKHLEQRLTDTASSVLTLERAVLAKAFRGDLVLQDPSDEPAEAMLARLNVNRDEATTESPRVVRSRSRKAG